MWSFPVHMPSSWSTKSPFVSFIQSLSLALVRSSQLFLYICLQILSRPVIERHVLCFFSPSLPQNSTSWLLIKKGILLKPLSAALIKIDFNEKFFSFQCRLQGIIRALQNHQRVLLRFKHQAARFAAWGSPLSHQGKKCFFSHPFVCHL